jgi:hypothetical protein
VPPVRLAGTCVGFLRCYHYMSSPSAATRFTDEPDGVDRQASAKTQPKRTPAAMALRLAMIKGSRGDGGTLSRVIAGLLNAEWS